MKARSSTLQGAVAACIATILTCLVAEIALRVLQYPSAIESGWGWDRSPRRGLAAPGDTGKNELGLRGASFSYGTEDIVVLLLGDSQVEAATSDRQWMPERILESHLLRRLGSRKVKVFSLASSGWGQDQQLLALERYFQQHRADVVIAWATPGNDFWENTFPDRSVTRDAGHIKPTFWFDGRALEGPFFAEDVHLSVSRLWELALRARLRTLNQTPQQYILNTWTAQLPSDNRPFDPETSKICERHRTIEQQELLKELLSLEKNGGVVVRTREDVEHSRSHFSPYIEPRSDKDDYLLAITRALLKRMKRTATEHGATFKVFYPIRSDFDQSGKKGLRCIESFDGQQFTARWDMLGTLKSVVDEEDLLTVDVPGGEEISVSNIDRHLSDTGNDRAMRLLAQDLLEKHIIPLH